MWGALVGGASGIISSGISAFENRQANKKARSDWRKSLQRGPSYMVEGLKKAGLNPMLAVGKGVPQTAFQMQRAPMAPPNIAGDAERATNAIQKSALNKYSKEIAMATRDEANARSHEAVARKNIAQVEAARQQQLWKFDEPIYEGNGMELRGINAWRQNLMGQSGDAVGAAATTAARLAAGGAARSARAAAQLNKKAELSLGLRRVREMERMGAYRRTQKFRGSKQGKRK